MKWMNCVSMTGNMALNVESVEPQGSGNPSPGPTLLFIFLFQLERWLLQHTNIKVIFIIVIYTY